MGRVIDGNKQDEAAQMLARSIELITKAGSKFIQAGSSEVAGELLPHVEALRDIACRYLLRVTSAELSREAGE